MGPTEGDKPVDSWDAESLETKFERVRTVWRPRSEISAYDDYSATVREVRLVGSDAVLIFDWPGVSKPFGLHIDLGDTSREFYYGNPVASFDEWVEYLDVYVMVSLGTGVTNRSPHSDHGDYIGIYESGA